MTFDLPTVERMIAHYATLQGLVAEGWTFACEIVAGLMHHGEPAWATVESDPAAKTARVKVRDLVKTPIPGVADPWTELKITMSHEMWHPWLTVLIAEPSVANEEKLAEAAAQAVVRSEGADARIMARSTRAIPDAVRARVAAKVERAREDQERDDHGRFGSGAGEAAHAAAKEASKAAYAHQTPPNRTGSALNAATLKEARAGEKSQKESAALHAKAAEAHRAAAAQHLKDGDVAHAVEASAQAARHEGAVRVAKYEAGVHKQIAAHIKGAKARSVARGGTMDPKMVQEALDALIAEGQGDSACAKILKGIIASLASKGAGGDGAVEPDGDELNAPVDAREENPDMDPTKKPGASPAGPPAARPMARVDQDARARKAADSLNVSAIRARIHTARIVDGIDISPALEKEILAETEIEGAEKLIRVVTLAKGDGARARTETGARPTGTPPPRAPKKYDADKLVSEGIHPTMAKLIADETNEEAAELSYKAARARIVQSTSPWPTRKPAGGVS